MYDLSSSALYEAAGQKRALPSAIKPVAEHFKVCGQTFTVLCSPEDNLWLHRAIYAAKAGDVLVVATGSAYEAGYWGEIMTHAALYRKLGGLVIDGCVRDIERLETLNFPIFARGLCIKGTGKDIQSQGNIGSDIQIDSVTVATGDFIFGDRDGVVVIPKNRVTEAIEKSKEREKKEKQIIEALQAGASTLDIYKFG